MMDIANELVEWIKEVGVGALAAVATLVIIAAVIIFFKIKKSINERLKKTEEKIGDAKDKVGGVGEKVGGVEDKIGDVEDKIGDLEDKIENVLAAVSSVQWGSQDGVQYNSLSIEHNALNARLVDLRKRVDYVTKRTHLGEKAAERLSKDDIDAVALKHTVDALIQNFGDSQVKMEKLRDDRDRVVNELNELRIMNERSGDENRALQLENEKLVENNKELAKTVESLKKVIETVETVQQPEIDDEYEL